MKILLVAPQSKDTVLGVIGNYCRKALISLGYNIEVFDFRESRYFKTLIGRFLKKAIKKVYSFPREQISFVSSLENQKMNMSLCQKVRQYQPDIMLVLMGDTIYVETLEYIKKQGVITANWFTDTVIDPRHNRIPFVQQVSPHYNYFFIYDSEDVLEHIEIGAPCVRSIPLACDPSIHKSVNLTAQEKRQYGSEVCFVGSIDSQREKLLKSLTDFNLGIWGNWEKEEALLSRFYRKKHVYFEEAVKIYNASEITLDIHIFFGAGKKAFDINPRVFEATGSGAFVLTNESPYLAEFYDIDKEIVCYHDKDDLKTKIKYYLEHKEERKMIAKKGQQRAHQDHTYEQRLEKIFSIIENNK